MRIICNSRFYIPPPCQFLVVKHPSRTKQSDLEALVLQDLFDRRMITGLDDFGLKDDTETTIAHHFGVGIGDIDRFPATAFIGIDFDHRRHVNV